MTESAATSMAGASAAEAATEKDDRFTDALEQNYARIHRLAARFGFRGAEAEDAVQEIVALAWAARATFRGDSTTSTWLTRIAVNYLTSYRRKLARRWRLWNDRLRHTHPPELDAANANDAPSIDRERILTAVDALPARLRRVFVLRYLEEMNVEETADILNIPTGTVRSRGYHARMRLREALKDLEP